MGSATGSTAATVPSGPGSHSSARRPRDASPRPPASTVTRRPCRCPHPSPSPSHRDDVTVSRRGLRSPGSSPPTATSTAPRSRTRATRRRASARPQPAVGGDQHHVEPVDQGGHHRRPPARSRPGSATSTRRSKATPSSDAATSPSEPSPTAATHEPACDAPAARASASDVAPATPGRASTATVVPRRSPDAGSRASNAGSTGSRRSRARSVGRTRSASASTPVRRVRSLVRTIPGHGVASELLRSSHGSMIEHLFVRGKGGAGRPHGASRAVRPPRAPSMPCFPAMAADVLTDRALNRATLARQMLLERSTTVDPLTAVDHLVGLQAQNPLDPYLALWSRLADFDPDVVGRAVEDRRLVRVVVMRGTIHLRDRRRRPRPPRRHPAGARRRDRPPPEFAPHLRGVDVAPGPRPTPARCWPSSRRTMTRLRAAIAERFPDVHAGGARPTPPAASCRWCRSRPAACGDGRGRSRVTPVDAWLGRPLGTATAPDDAVLRYLAAFGPATVADVAAWCRLTGMREVLDRLAPAPADLHRRAGPHALRRARRPAARPRRRGARALPARVRQLAPVLRRPQPFGSDEDRRFSGAPRPVQGQRAGRRPGAGDLAARAGGAEGSARPSSSPTTR